MYLPPPFRIADRVILIEAMRTHAFATLFGRDAEGTPTASHLPLIVQDEGEHGVLEGHFAKASPHWRGLAGEPEVLVVFGGPHGYVSPSLYDERNAVPTWNYVAVHAYGKLLPITERAEKDALLKRLIALHEPTYAETWRSLPADFQGKMLDGITGFRIPIRRIEGKFKLSQNRPAADRARVRAAHAAGIRDQQALAGWMERLGI